MLWIKPLNRCLFNVPHSDLIKKSSCLGCHGIDATGLPSLGKDLVASNFVQGLGDDELVTFIKTGRSPGDPLNTTGLDMPAKGGNPMLSDADIRAIIAWLRSIQK